MLLMCLSVSDLKAMAGLWHVEGMFATCQLMTLAATTPSSRKFVIKSIPISDAVAKWPV
jgi:hypothetical protein